MIPRFTQGENWRHCSRHSRAESEAARCPLQRFDSALHLIDRWVAQAGVDVSIL